MRDAYHSLLLEYASGTLDEAQALAVAAHLSLSHRARAAVSQCESIAGIMLSEQCAPIAMKRGAFEALLQRLDTEAAPTSAPLAQKPHKPCAGAQDLPECLAKYLDAIGYARHPHVTDSVRENPYLVRRLSVRCRKSDARIIEIYPDAQVMIRTGGAQIVIVLEGSADIGGTRVSRGDLVILDELRKTALRAMEDGVLLLIARPRVTLVRDFFLRWIRPVA